MTQQYRYHRPGLRLEFYREIYDYSEQHTADQIGEQPRDLVDLFTVTRDDHLNFDTGVTDTRGFSVNTPNGNTLAEIDGFLADAANDVIPYAYVKLTTGQVVVVPTNQFTIYPEQQIVVLEGGIDALRGAPIATMTPVDATTANHYWSEYRRRNAA